MGKSGALLRQQKMQNTVYTFTKEQLELHDRMILENKRKQIMDTATKKVEDQMKKKEEELNERIRSEWKEREAKFHTEDRMDDFFMMMQLLLSVSVRVLVEKFHWKSLVAGKNDRRLRVSKFSDYLIDEINMLINDEMADIRQYCDETYKLYGVKFDREE